MPNPALLIGSSQDRLQVMHEVLKGLGWSIKVAQRPQEIMSAMQERYEAIFCDEVVKGATVSGIQRFALKVNPKTPFYLFRNLNNTKSIQLVAEPKGILAFPPILSQLPKPDDWERDPNLTQTFVPFAGNSSLVPLTDVLSAMGMDKRSATIEIARGQIGVIYVNSGLIEDAISFIDSSPVRGLKALGQLLQLSDIAYRVLQYKVPSQLSIKLKVDSALTEASRLADEGKRYDKLVGDLRLVCPSIDALAIGYPLSATPAKGFGHAEPAFRLAKELLERNRETITGRLNEFFITTDRAAYALVHLAEGNILIASCPVKDRAVLFKAIQNTQVASYV